MTKHCIIRVANNYVITNPWLAKYTGFNKHLGCKEKALHFLTPACALRAKFQLMDAGVNESIIEVKSVPCTQDHCGVWKH